jgi:alpha-glucosidase
VEAPPQPLIGVTPTIGDWCRTAVLYQIYPRSFADSDGDGVGDIPGIIGHLDHLEWLGIDGVWLSPVTVSPNADWGYDVSDFCGIAPEFGTLDDFDRLVALANDRGIRVLMDMVPNHTSNRHPWFLDSRSSRESRHRDWYLWADGPADGGPPNNWVSSFGGSGWTLDEATGQHYFHNHLAEQPDLNWWNEDVRDAFDAIFRFWCDRGVAGFRIDVCNVIVKDAELRDNPPATEDDDFEAQMFGQRFVYNANRPEVHEVIRRWRRQADSYDAPRLLIGETPVTVEQMAEFYGDGCDELGLAFNFDFIAAPLDAGVMRDIVERTEAALPPAAWPAWTGSNHDMFRFPTRWAGNDPRRVRLALLMLLTLRGTPVLYQGDEIGMGDVKVAHISMKDPLGVRFYPYYEGRDAARTPMQWRDGAGGGFTQGESPWLPLGDVSAVNVAAQRDDAQSVLAFCRDVIAYRRQHPAFVTSGYESLGAPEGVWAFGRGETHAVCLNMSASPVRLDGFGGTVAICTDRARDGDIVGSVLTLAAHEGLILEIGSRSGPTARAPSLRTAATGDG